LPLLLLLLLCCCCCCPDRQSIHFVVAVVVIAATYGKYELLFIFIEANGGVFVTIFCVASQK